MVYSLVVQEESHHTSLSVSDDSSSLLNAVQRSQGRGKGPLS
ncbi:hypothetical protein A2U01_0113102, partial [Trifolium medium]|nr:hypothetical protein [Trifolium medium]